MNISEGFEVRKRQAIKRIIGRAIKAKRIRIARERRMTGKYWLEEH